MFAPRHRNPTLAIRTRVAATFQRFNGDELYPGEAWSEEGPLTFPAAKATTGVIDGYLPTTVAYCRWFWNVLEPEEGRYDFSMIEKVAGGL